MNASPTFSLAQRAPPVPCAFVLPPRGVCHLTRAFSATAALTERGVVLYCIAFTALQQPRRCSPAKAKGHTTATETAGSDGWRSDELQTACENRKCANNRQDLKTGIALWIAGINVFTHTRCIKRGARGCEAQLTATGIQEQGARRRSGGWEGHARHDNARTLALETCVARLHSRAPPSTSFDLVARRRCTRTSRVTVG